MSTDTKPMLSVSESFRRVSSLILGFSVLLLVHVFGERPALDLYDGMQRRYPEKRVGEVALVNVDQASLEAMLREQGVQFPFDRAVYGEFIDAVARLGAKAVAFDILFSEPSIRGPRDDAAFAEAIARSSIPVIFPGTPGESRVPMPLEEFQHPVVRYGDVELYPSADGVFRFVPPRGQTLSRMMAEAVGAGSRALRNSGWLHYTRPGSIPEVPFYNVLISKRDDSSGRGVRNELRNLIEGRAVIVSYKAPGLLDVRATPMSPDSVGSWIQANALNGVLLDSRGIFPLPLPGLAGALLLVALLWGAALALVRPNRPSVLFSLAVGFSLVPVLLLTHLLWDWTIWLNPLPVIGGMLAMTGAHFLGKVRGDWKERLAFSRMLQHSMSPELLELIRSGRMQVSRFGESRPLGILFADLAGFTSLAEKLEPERLVELVNDYLDEAVQVLIPRGAYIDKFIGDAVMALWGAPVAARLNLDEVAQAALELSGISERLGARWSALTGIPVSPQVRIGLHFGTAIVGNVGARKRFNYTAVGDAVNVASRLESLGKLYQSSLLVSGDFIERVSPALQYRFILIDRVVLKGRTEPTLIFGAAEMLTDAQRQDYDLALQAYASGRFSDAGAAFRRVSGFPAAAVLADRCDRLTSGESLENWSNGSWRLDEK